MCREAANSDSYKIAKICPTLKTRRQSHNKQDILEMNKPLLLTFPLVLLSRLIQPSAAGLPTSLFPAGGDPAAQAEAGEGGEREKRAEAQQRPSGEPGKQQHALRVLGIQSGNGEHQNTSKCQSSASHSHRVIRGIYFLFLGSSRVTVWHPRLTPGVRACPS